MTYIPDDLAVREAAATALTKIADLKAQRQGSRQEFDLSDLPDEMAEKIGQIQAEEAAALKELGQVFRLRIRDVCKAHGLVTQELIDLDDAIERAEAAYDAMEGGALLVGDGGVPVRCKISGVPVWTTDEALEDYDTGEVVLRAAIGLPPRPIDEDADGDEDIPE